MERIRFSVPPALHGDESGLSAVGLGWQAGLCAPSRTVTGSAARKGEPPKEVTREGSSNPPLVGSVHL